MKLVDRPAENDKFVENFSNFDFSPNANIRFGFSENQLKIKHALSDGVLKIEMLLVVRSTLLHLYLSAGLRLVLGLTALLHFLHPLTLYFW